jgi:hypothetical protein
MKVSSDPFILIINSVMTRWNPSKYLKFGAARLRPAIDLLNSAVSSFPDPHLVKSVFDLGYLLTFNS